MLDSGPKQRRTNELAAWPTADLRAHRLADTIPPLSRSEYETLAADIAEHGIATPLAVTTAGVVLDGHHRLRAAKELGTETVPVRIVAPADERAYMLRLALACRSLSEGQRAALAVELEYERLNEAARRRQRANLRNAPEVASSPPRGKTRELLATMAHTSPRTVQAVLSVYKADRALFERIKSGRLAADAAARRVRRGQRDAASPPAPPLPSGPFELIYADPPWQLGSPDSSRAPENHYETLPLEQLTALQPPAAEDALLLLWAVNCLLPQALQTIQSWGFEYLTNQAWTKQTIGLGHWTRNQHELLLLARRGRFSPPQPEDVPSSVIDAPRGKHSQKPQQVYELIERAYPHASKLELFARGKVRPGWNAWGKEVEA